MEPNKNSRPHHLKMMAGVFITCLLVYLLFWSGRHYSIDGIVMFEYAKSILFHGSFQMNPPVRWGVDFSVGKWPIGLTFTYMPILLTLSKMTISDHDLVRNIPYDPGAEFNPVLMENNVYLYGSLLNPVITALTAALLYLFAFRLGFSSKKACAIALVFGLASPAAVYAKFDYAQPFSSLFLLLAFLFIFNAPYNSPLYPVLAGISMGIAFLGRPEMLLMPAPILAVGVYLLSDLKSSVSRWDRTRLKNLIAFSLPLLAFVIFNQYINYLKFGSIISLGYQPSSEFTLDPEHILTASAGNLISPGRGIFVFFPLSILSTLGILVMYRRKRIYATILAGSLIGSIVLYSTWKDWGGGISWGPRFLIPFLPYLTILAFYSFEAHHLPRKNLIVPIGAFLIAVGAVITLQGLATNFLEFYSRLDIPQPIVDQGNYHYSPGYSPILKHWEPLNDPREYDSYWLKNKYIKKSKGKNYFVLFALLFSLGYAAKSWLDFFLRPETQASHSSLK